MNSWTHYLLTNHNWTHSLTQNWVEDTFGDCFRSTHRVGLQGLDIFSGQGLQSINADSVILSAVRHLLLFWFWDFNLAHRSTIARWRETDRTVEFVGTGWLNRLLKNPRTLFSPETFSFDVMFRFVFVILSSRILFILCFSDVHIPNPLWIANFSFSTLKTWHFFKSFRWCSKYHKRREGTYWS